MRKLLTVALLCALFGNVSARGDATQTPVFRGTVNIVLGNANGIVALTDSRQTDGRTGRSYPLSAQKLFQLDGKTVCTIAGFGGTTLPGFPEFISTAAGILDRYAAQKDKTPQSFDGKVKALAYLFEFYLMGIANVQGSAPSSADLYFSQLIVAGYDVDGAPRMAKITLKTTISSGGVFSTYAELTDQKTVGTELVHETSGIAESVVESILAKPAQFADDKALARYASMKASDHGKSLTVAEMTTLARALARHAASAYPIAVGGRDQIAVLEKGEVQQPIDQQYFPPRPVNTIDFSIVTGLALDPRLFPHYTLVRRPLQLFVKDRFVCTNEPDRSDIWLDNTFYFEVEFVNCIIHYVGGIMEFDASNRVTNGMLSLGIRVDRDSERVRDLTTKFAWARVECCEGP